MVLLILENNIALVINAVMHKRKRKAIATAIGHYFVAFLCFSYVNVYQSRIVHILKTQKYTMRISAEKFVCSDIFPDQYKPILRKSFFKNFEILWTGFVDLNIVENCKQYCARYKFFEDE
ncbi:hypothetical protein T09_2416 [Trichinella sp. T9]|nr:hypothetical protein T09_2416 [Trichinella sp. T9]